jgi:hypothetical protein
MSCNSTRLETRDDGLYLDGKCILESKEAVVHYYAETEKYLILRSEIPFTYFVYEKSSGKIIYDFASSGFYIYLTDTYLVYVDEFYAATWYYCDLKNPVRKKINFYVQKVYTKDGQVFVEGMKYDENRNITRYSQNLITQEKWTRTDEEEVPPLTFSFIGDESKYIRELMEQEMQGMEGDSDKE